ncbi:MAG: hypothetical protein PVI43_00935 [Candidatus Bathyarchaeota archaeon]|jgi:hypothetical protein
MAVLKDYDSVCSELNNLPNYDVCYPTRYQKEKYEGIPINRHNCPDQAPDAQYYFEQEYMKDHRR